MLLLLVVGIPLPKGTAPSALRQRCPTSTTVTARAAARFAGNAGCNGLWPTDLPRVHRAGLASHRCNDRARQFRWHLACDIRRNAEHRRPFGHCDAWHGGYRSSCRLRRTHWAKLVAASVFARGVDRLCRARHRSRNWVVADHHGNRGSGRQRRNVSPRNIDGFVPARFRRSHCLRLCRALSGDLSGFDRGGLQPRLAIDGCGCTDLGCKLPSSPLASAPTDAQACARDGRIARFRRLHERVTGNFVVATARIRNPCDASLRRCNSRHLRGRCYRRSAYRRSGYPACHCIDARWYAREVESYDENLILTD